MGAVEDVRQVIQDFVAPEVRALDARIAALEALVKMGFEHVDAKFVSAEKAVAAGFANVDAKFVSAEKSVAAGFAQVDAKFVSAQKAVDARFASAEQLATARHELLVARLDSFRAEIVNRLDKVAHDLDLDRRVEALEVRRASRRVTPAGGGERKVIASST